MTFVTDNLMQYPLPGKLSAKLKIADRVAQSLARAGHAVPSSIAMDGSDFDAVDVVVRASSGNRFTAATVCWNGRPLVRVRSALAA